MFINKKTIKRIYVNSYSYIHYLVARPSKNIPTTISKILFVCSGNVCRSPMAEYIAKNTAQNYGLTNIEYYSRGISVSKSNPPENNAILVSKSKGIDISSHKSKALKKQDMLKADLILVMEYKQLQILRKKYPFSKNKIRLLPCYIEKKGVNSQFENMMIIKDPYGGSLKEFEECHNIITNCITNIFKYIQISNSSNLS